MREIYIKKLKFQTKQTIIISLWEKENNSTHSKTDEKMKVSKSYKCKIYKGQFTCQSKNLC